MKPVLFAPLVLLAGCTAIPTVTPLGKEDRFVYLVADTDPTATKCGGYFNDVRMQDMPLQSSAPKCRLSVEAKNGSNTWVACNSNTSGEACASPFTFNLKGGKP